MSTQATINIGGMACNGCADTVQESLNSIKGVEKTTVDLDQESADVLYDADVISAEDFQKTIDEAGYEFKGMKN